MIDFVNYYGSIVSLIVGLLSIWLSVVFYRAAKISEVESAKLLKAIEKSVDTLSVINNELLSKALQHLASSNTQMIDIIGQYNRNIQSAQGESIPLNQTGRGGNVRTDILSEIDFLTKLTGRVISIDLFERLKHKYDFGTILMEINIMAKDGIIAWLEYPNPPKAMSEITLKQTT